MACGAFVNCAGPYAAAVHQLALAAAGDSDGEALAALPLENEIAAKAVLCDALGAVPMEAPMMIWEDEIDLGWSDEERADLLSMGGLEASLAKPLPARTCGRTRARPDRCSCFGRRSTWTCGRRAAARRA